MSKIAQTGMQEPLVTKRPASTEQSPEVSGIAMPMVRRIFPQLIAESVVGVQPMSGPSGFTFALRANYGNDIKEAYKKWKKTHRDEDRGFAHFKKHTWPMLKALKEL